MHFGTGKSRARWAAWRDTHVMSATRATRARSNSGMSDGAALTDWRQTAVQMFCMNDLIIVLARALR